MSISDKISKSDIKAKYLVVFIDYCGCAQWIPSFLEAPSVLELIPISLFPLTIQIFVGIIYEKDVSLYFLW